MKRRLRGFEGGNDGLGCAHRIARLLAAIAFYVLAPGDSGFSIIGDRGFRGFE
jgi:hypothetical protein